jgi:hypothetical protein
MQGYFLSIRGFLAVSAALMALLLAAGCGGGDSSTSTATTAAESSPNESSASPPGGSSEGSPEDSSGSPSGKTPNGSPDGSPESPGNGGGASGEAATSAKAEFIQQANTICKGTKKDFEREAEPFIEEVNKNPPKPTEDPPEETLVVTILVPNFQNQIDEIGSLSPPSGDEEEIDAFLDALQETIDDASEEPATFVKNGGSFGQAPKLAKAYGLSGCAEL